MPPNGEQDANAEWARRRRGSLAVRLIRQLAAVAAGYGVGNMPSADLAGRVAGGVDLREAGTANPGAMNAAHVLGKKWGIAVSSVDMGKGVLAGRLGHRLAGPTGANLAATAAVVGHCFPLGRSGGKGVATSLGQVIATFPAYLPIDIGVALGTAVFPGLSQRTRVATGVASATWVGCATIAWMRRFSNPGGVECTAALPLAALATSVVIAVRFHTEADHVAAFNEVAGLSIERPKAEL